MELNDDFYDVRESLVILRKNRPVSAFEQIMRRLEELEKENEELKNRASR